MFFFVAIEIVSELNCKYERQTNTEVHSRVNFFLSTNSFWVDAKSEYLKQAID